MSKSLLEKIKQGRQYRSMTFECRIDENEEEKSYIVEGYAATFNEPYSMGEFGNYRFKEQVSETAFDKCDMTDVIMQYDHKGRVYARISNNTLSLMKDSHGLKIIANLGGTEEGRKLYEEIKGGYTNKMSFGFTVDDDEQTRTKDEDGKTLILRTIKSVNKLFDVSAVSIPANDGTEISARSYLDGVIESEKKAEAERLLEERKKELKLEMSKAELKQSF